jgi:hypothetical protein
MKFSDLKPGMEVIFDRKSIDLNRWRRLNHNDYQRFSEDIYQNPIQYYEKRYKRYENVPLKVLWIDNIPAYHRPGNMVMKFLKPDGNTEYITDDFFDPTNENSFQLSPLVQKARDVRNTRLMAARMGLPEGPEGIIASFVSGIDKKSSGQQQDILIQRRGIPYVAPKRGGKSRRGRKNRRRTRKH